MDILPIETPRLLLRQFAVEDAEDVFAIFSDEQTTLDCGGYHAFDAMDEEYGRLMQKFAGQTRYSVVEKKTGRVVAVISMMDAGRAVPGWDLGIEVAPDARRKGYAREALAAVVRTYFEQTDTVLFTGGHYAYNTASGALLKQLGFVYEGGAQGNAPFRTRPDGSGVLFPGKRMNAERFPLSLLQEAADFLCKSLASGPPVRYA